jgi:hypothetical protein
MISRKFAVGDRVRLNIDGILDHRPLDVHTISRMLPAQDNVWQYRVKRVLDGQERLVNEVQLMKLRSG